MIGKILGQKGRDVYGYVIHQEYRTRVSTNIKEYKDGSINKRAILLQVLFPILCGLIALFSKLYFKSVGNIVSGIAVIAALLCAVAIALFQIRLDLRNKLESDEDAFIIENDLRLVDQLFSTIMWSIICGFSIVALSLIVDWSGVLYSPNHLWARIFSSIIIAAMLHLAFLIGTILKRLYRVYEVVAKNRR